MLREATGGSVAIAVLLVLGTATTGVVGGEQAPDQRLIVTELSSLDGDLGRSLDVVEGELVRVDERLDFAVVHAPLEPLASLHPGHVVPDPYVEGPQVDRAPDAGGGLPHDPYNDDQWALQFLDMEEAWALETGSSDVTVAVVDSGLDASHEDLDDLPVELGTDYVDGGTVDSDPHGHGTHITGIIAAERGNGIGITGMSEVSLLNVRVLDEDNGGFCSDFYSGIAEAADEGADVINYSIGSLCLATNLVDVHAALTANDALLVGITHNLWDDGSTTGQLNCLLVNQLDAYPNVMAVTAIGPDGEVTDFSCRAPWADVAAPGADVLSTVPEHRVGDYQGWWGTSMAAPHVTATAALMKSANPNLSAQELGTLIVGTADDAGPAGFDQAYGHGILDPDEALEAAIDHPAAP